MKMLIQIQIQLFQVQIMRRSECTAKTLQIVGITLHLLCDYCSYYKFYYKQINQPPIL